jgi:cytochrome c-type biogenesis protein CcmH/NrfG
MRHCLALAVVATVLASASAAPADTADSLIARSRTAERTGNTNAALRYAQSAIVADPARASSYVVLGDLYLHAAQTDSAGFYYAEALEIDPQNAEALRGMAVTDEAQKTQATAAAGSLDNQKDGH